MNKVLVGKKVIFFDVGYTIDYPASGDWMFTCKFNEVAGDVYDGFDVVNSLFADLGTVSDDGFERIDEMILCDFSDLHICYWQG